MRSTAASNTGDLLQAAARGLRRRFAERLGEHDLAPGQVRALRVVLGHAEPPRLSHLAERLRMAPRSATEVVDALQDRGLVERVPDPDDRRATRVRATPAGRELGAVLAETREQVTDAYLQALSEEDRSALHRILGRLEEEQ